MRLRGLAVKEVNNVLGFAKDINEQGRAGRFLKGGAAVGLVSIPDTIISQTLDGMTFNTSHTQRRQVGDPLPDSPNQETVIARFAKYLQANHEKAQIREQVLDNDPSTAANAAAGTGKTRFIAIQEASLAAERLFAAQPDPNALPTNLTKTLSADLSKKLTALQGAMGLQRQPTMDEARGLGFWQKYFAGRENNQNGESTVGRYLDTPEVQITADLLRYGGSNNGKVLANRTSLDFDSRELPGAEKHDWKSDRKLLRLDETQEHGKDDPDRDGNRGNNRKNAPDGRIKLSSEVPVK